MSRFRTCFHRAELASTANFDRWTRSGGLTAEQRAEELWRNRLEAHVPPPIDEAILRELDAYIARRTSELG
jgi:trimethylamine--corrinoid protein Co-methyltransferase